MSRAIALLVAATAVSCIDRDATDSHAGAVTIPSTAQSVSICPEGSDCPDFLPCDELGETSCRNRSDCEVVYDPQSSTPKFLACRSKAAVCRGEGESCLPDPQPDDTQTCCPGLYCCAGGLITGKQQCMGACPVGGL